jgi:hypothetical protein
MPFEIIDGIIGSTIAELISKIFPPRKGGEFSDMPLDVFERRNKWLYRGMILAFVVGFFAPICLFIPVKNEGQIFPGFGAIIGLPFSSFFAYVILVRLIAGPKRVRELLFFYEQKTRTHIYVSYFVGVPIALLGLISLVLLLRSQ